MNLAWSASSPFLSSAQVCSAIAGSSRCHAFVRQQLGAADATSLCCNGLSEKNRISEGWRCKLPVEQTILRPSCHYRGSCGITTSIRNSRPMGKPTTKVSLIRVSCLSMESRCRQLCGSSLVVSAESILRDWISCSSVQDGGPSLQWASLSTLAKPWSLIACCLPFRQAARMSCDAGYLVVLVFCYATGTCRHLRLSRSHLYRHALSVCPTK